MKLEFRCVNCKISLNYLLMWYSGGSCPFCGYRGKNASIISVTEHPYIVERYGKWWQVREKRRKYLRIRNEI